MSITRVQVSPAKSCEDDQKDGMSVTRVLVSPARTCEDASPSQTEQLPSLHKASPSPDKDSHTLSDVPEDQPSEATECKVSDSKSQPALVRSLSDNGWAGKPVKRQSAW